MGPVKVSRYGDEILDALAPAVNPERNHTRNFEAVDL